MSGWHICKYIYIDILSSEKRKQKQLHVTDYITSLQALVLQLMRDEQLAKSIVLPDAPVTMTEAMNVSKDKEADVSHHERRFSFV